MGLGAAASEPGTLSMLRHLYPDGRSRSRAIGVWAACSGFALAHGAGRRRRADRAVELARPSSGSTWCFGLAVLAAGTVDPAGELRPRRARVDTAGTLLGGGGAGHAGLRDHRLRNRPGSRSATVIALLCVSAVLAAGFVLAGAPGRRTRCSTCGSCGCRSSRRLTSSRSAPISRRSPSSSSPRCTWTRWSAVSGFQHRPGVPADDGADDRLVAAGRPLDGRAGPRWSITIGCVLLAAGLLLAATSSARTRPTGR